MPNRNVSSEKAVDFTISFALIPTSIYDTQQQQQHPAQQTLLVFNSLSPGRSEFDSKNVIFNLVLLIGIFRSSHDNALQWMPQDLTDDKSTLVQVMAWCRQATSHYLSQCWLSSLLPYGVTRPQWVKLANSALCYGNSVESMLISYYSACTVRHCIKCMVCCTLETIFAKPFCWNHLGPISI